MSPSRLAEYRMSRRNRDRYLERLSLPGDERASAVEAICFGAACFGLVLVTLWAAVN